MRPVAEDVTMTPLIACEYVTDKVSLNQLSSIDVDNKDIANALENLNNTLALSCADQAAESYQDIAQAINLLNDTIAVNANKDNLIQALDKLNTTLSSTPDGSLTEVLGGAIFSVIAAFIFNFLYWKVKERNERLRSAVFEAKDALIDFEDNAVEYWSRDYDSKNIKTNTVQQAKIKANHTLLLSTYTNRILPNLTRSQKNTEKLAAKKNVQHEIENLFDIATGGEFESSTRKANKKNVSDIIRRCTRIRTRLANISS